MKKGMRIVFLGTPEFSIRPLKALINAGYEITGIITAPDKPVGRKILLTPPPIKSFILEHESWNIKVYQPQDKNSLLEILKKLRPDLAVVAAFGMILSKATLEIPKYGFLNIHASLLPRWRGASPIQSAILAGDKKTGITIMLINEKMDEGAILATQEIKIENLNYKELENTLSELGAELLVETIPKWINKEIAPQAQDDSKATYCKKITKEDGLIDLEKESPEIIARKIRAFTPWPGAYIFTNPDGASNKRLIITQAEPDKNNELKIKRVKPEGKNEMDFSDYLRGNPNESLKKFL